MIRALEAKVRRVVWENNAVDARGANTQSWPLLEQAQAFLDDLWRGDRFRPVRIKYAHIETREVSEWKTVEVKDGE